MNSNAIFTEKEILNDALNSEKQMITAYGIYLAESTCQNLRSELMKIINEKQQIQFEIFDTMKQKGWYNVKNANMNDVQTTTQKYQGMQQQMQ
ncbi:MAG: spore coat protein [Clostridiaceae bacterium]|nr:spore coat protein [Clostridiaceae bacterium]